MFGLYRNLIKGPIFAARTMIYAKMTQDGMKRGNDSIKKSNILKQYNEVAEEIGKLQNLLKEAEDSDDSIDLQSLMDQQFDKEFGYSLMENDKKRRQMSQVDNLSLF